MSDEQEKPQPKGGVRRVGKEDRKKRLESRPLEFPPEKPKPQPEDTLEEDTTPGEPVSEEEIASSDDDAAVTEPEIKPEEDTTRGEPVSEDESSDTAEAETEPESTAPDAPDEKIRRFEPERPPTLPPMTLAPPAPEAPPIKVSAEDARFAPPEVQHQQADDAEAESTESPEEVFEPILAVTEEIQPTRKKNVTAPEDRYPPVRPQRDLPADVQPSPTPRPKPAQKKRVSFARILANLVTLLVIGIVIAMIGFAVYIYRNPYSDLNPLAPPTPFPVIITATFLPPTITPTVTFTPVAVSDAALAVATEEVEVAPTSLGGSVATPVESIFPFELMEPPGVIYTPNGNGRGCEWSSIAGTVVDLNGEPLDGLGVRVTNQVTQEENTVFTGSSATFGDGGFEFITGTSPELDGYFVQLLSPAGAPLSPQLTIVTSDKCTQNVAVISFRQTQAY